MSKTSLLRDFAIQKELGRGSYGIAYLVNKPNSSDNFVLKRINLSHLSLKHQQAAHREVEILKSLNHPNIIKFYHSFLEENVLSIITEYAEGGDLYKLLLKHRHRKTQIPENELWRIFDELSRALSYLHKKSIIHRDVKCQNVFLTKNHTVKLGDMGASKLVTGDLQATRVGTPLYLAPEMIKQKPYDFKIDIWGLGCIMYTLATRDSPFIGSSLITLGISIINRTPKALPLCYSRKLNNLVLMLLEKDPEDRPDIKEIRNMTERNPKGSEEISWENAKTIKIFEEEVSGVKVIRQLRPRPLPPVALAKVPLKPIFKAKVQSRLSCLDLGSGKSEKIFDVESMAKRKSGVIFRDSSQKCIKVEDFLRKEQKSPGIINENKVDRLPTRPGTAKPSLRTIIRSNSLVKINTYLPPNKSSKLKFTINDLLNYQ